MAEVTFDYEDPFGSDFGPVVPDSMASVADLETEREPQTKVGQLVAWYNSLSDEVTKQERANVNLFDPNRGGKGTFREEAEWTVRGSKFIDKVKELGIPPYKVVNGTKVYLRTPARVSLEPLLNEEEKKEYLQSNQEFVDINTGMSGADMSSPIGSYSTVIQDIQDPGALKRFVASPVFSFTAALVLGPMANSIAGSILGTGSAVAAGTATAGQVAAQAALAKGLSSAATTALQGGDFNDALTSGLISGVTSYASPFIANGLDKVGFTSEFLDKYDIAQDDLAKAVGQAVSRGATGASLQESIISGIGTYLQNAGVPGVDTPEFITKTKDFAEEVIESAENLVPSGVVTAFNKAQETLDSMGIEDAESLSQLAEQEIQRLEDEEILTTDQLVEELVIKAEEELTNLAESPVTISPTADVREDVTSEWFTPAGDLQVSGERGLTTDPFSDVVVYEDDIENILATYEAGGGGGGSSSAGSAANTAIDAYATTPPETAVTTSTLATDLPTSVSEVSAPSAADALAGSVDVPAPLSTVVDPGSSLSLLAGATLENYYQPPSQDTIDDAYAQAMSGVQTADEDPSVIEANETVAAAQADLDAASDNVATVIEQTDTAIANAKARTQYMLRTYGATHPQTKRARELEKKAKQDARNEVNQAKTAESAAKTKYEDSIKLQQGTYRDAQDNYKLAQVKARRDAEAAAEAQAQEEAQKALEAAQAKAAAEQAAKEQEEREAAEAREAAAQQEQEPVEDILADTTADDTTEPVEEPIDTGEPSEEPIDTTEPGEGVGTGAGGGDGTGVGTGIGTGDGTGEGSGSGAGIGAGLAVGLAAGLMKPQGVTKKVFEDYTFTPMYQAPEPVQKATMYETPEFAPSLFRNMIG